MKNNFKRSITKGSGNAYQMSIHVMMQIKGKELETIL